MLCYQLQVRSREIVIPGRFTSYEYLAKSMNMALEYGSTGYEFQ